MKNLLLIAIAFFPLFSFSQSIDTSTVLQKAPLSINPERGYKIEQEKVERVDLEEITIEKTYLTRPIRSIDCIYPEDITFFSLEEIADYSSSIDLKKRSPFGIQQDLSLRGSIFEDNFINLGGIEINDPQTGHFSLELPLTSADLEKVEIIKNSQKVNFIVKKPENKGFLLKTSFGQHALCEKLLSLNFPLKRINNRLSIEHKVSNGGRQDTDFKIYNFSFHSLWENEEKDIEFLFGSTKRDFGANSFYSSFYSREEEHVTQRFFSLRAGLKEALFDWNNTLYFRRHSDKFILDRHNPSFYTNYHTTYVYGLKSEFDFKNDIFFTFDVVREKITSTNLDNHRRLKKGFCSGVREKRVGNFVFGLEAGLDYYENWEYLENAHIGLGYFLKEGLKLRFSFDRFWRAPSFTELYYSSPVNKGDLGLKVQKSNNFEAGIDYLPVDNFNLALSVFLRDQLDTIDWVKDNSLDAWKAKNVGNLKAYGFDFYAEAMLKSCLLGKVGLGYTYLNLDKKSPYVFSKYVFDYNRHKLVSNLGFNIKDILLNMIVNFSSPINRKKYTTFDLKIEKKIADFTLSLEGINIFNKDYKEMENIEASGRWYKAAIEYSF